jgi:hypothetical protein
MLNLPPNLGDIEHAKRQPTTGKIGARGLKIFWVYPYNYGVGLRVFSRVAQPDTLKEVYGMIQKRLFYGLSAVVALAAASFLSGCGGGGSSAPTPGTLTGSAAVGSSAVSRVGRASIGSLQNQLNRIRPAQGSANLITRGRQGLDFDEELGLYYRYRSDATGVWIELFEDAAGQRPAGEIVCKEDDSSYETIINIGTGAQQQRAYFRLTETNDSTRFKLRARYEDPRTGERTSIEGDLIVAASRNPAGRERAMTAARTTGTEKTTGQTISTGGRMTATVATTISVRTTNSSARTTFSSALTRPTTRTLKM